MTDSMNASVGPLFDRLRAEWVDTPEKAEEYERNVRTMVMIRTFLMAIDAERQRAGLSKSELARKIGMDESVVRRLLSKEGSNPTLRTVLEMLSALNIEVELKPPQSAAGPSPRKKPQRSKGGKAPDSSAAA